jgi:hypothetical protein
MSEEFGRRVLSKIDRDSGGHNPSAIKLKIVATPKLQFEVVYTDKIGELRRPVPITLKDESMGPEYSLERLEAINKKLSQLMSELWEVVREYHQAKTGEANAPEGNAASQEAFQTLRHLVSVDYVQTFVDYLSGLNDHDATLETAKEIADSLDPSREEMIETIRSVVKKHRKIGSFSRYRPNNIEKNIDEWIGMSEKAAAQIQRYCSDSANLYPIYADHIRNIRAELLEYETSLKDAANAFESGWLHAALIIQDNSPRGYISMQQATEIKGEIERRLAKAAKHYQKMKSHAGHMLDGTEQSGRVKDALEEIETVLDDMAERAKIFEDPPKLKLLIEPVEQARQGGR